MFRDNQHYMLNNGPIQHQKLWDYSNLICEERDFTHVPFSNDECLGVYYTRLLSEGWQLQEGISDQDVQVFDKACSSFKLRKYCHIGSENDTGRGVYWDSHAAVDENGIVTDYPDWEWADIIDKNLAWARDGRLFMRKNVKRADLPQISVRGKLLCDFNDMKFEERVAPY
jgi:hypothetical protein